MKKDLKKKHKEVIKCIFNNNKQKEFILYFMSNGIKFLKDKIRNIKITHNIKIKKKT